MTNEIIKNNTYISNAITALVEKLMRNPPPPSFGEIIINIADKGIQMHENFIHI